MRVGNALFFNTPRRGAGGRHRRAVPVFQFEGRYVTVSSFVFATRHPRRPNPVRITTVRLLARRGNVPAVAGVDMLDGTPLWDVKPYVPAFDRERGSVRWGWLAGKIPSPT